MVDALMKRLKLSTISPDDARIDWSFQPSFHLYIVLYDQVMTNVEESASGHPLYWRLHSSKKNLFCIEINRVTGRLLEISVPLYTDRFYPLRVVDEQSIENVVGVPLFDCQLWEPALALGPNPRSNKLDFVDITRGIRIELDELDLRIALFTEKIHLRVTTDNRLVCEFNKKGELCGITLKDFVVAERKILSRLA